MMLEALRVTRQSGVYVNGVQLDDVDASYGGHQSLSPSITILSVPQRPYRPQTRSPRRPSAPWRHDLQTSHALLCTLFPTPAPPSTQLHHDLHTLPAHSQLLLSLLLLPRHCQHLNSVSFLSLCKALYRTISNTTDWTCDLLGWSPVTTVVTTFAANLASTSLPTTNPTPYLTLVVASASSGRPAAPPQTRIFPLHKAFYLKCSQHHRRGGRKTWDHRWRVFVARGALRASRSR